MPAQTPAPASNATSSLGSLPGSFSAAAEPNSYDPGDNYDYKGKSSGSMYLGISSDTLAVRGLEELFFQLCCCVSFWFWREIIGFSFTYLRT
jgi:hypothetical protein